MNSALNAQLAKAVSAHQSGNFDEAGRLYRSVLAIHKSQPDALQRLGILEAQLGHLEASEKLLARAAKVAPNSAAVHLNRGAVLEQLQRLEEAVKSYGRAISCQPGYFQAHFNRANALDALGKPAEALVDYEQAVALHPNFAEGHYNRGKVLENLRRYDDALSSFDRAIAIAPDYAPAHDSRGRVLRALGRLGEAVESYDRALAIVPNYAAIHVNRGVVQHELGRSEEALASFETALSFAPESADALVNSSAVLLQLKRADEALSRADRALALEPENARAHCNRGSALRALGQLDSALESYDAAVSHAPDFVEAVAHRGVVLLQLGQYEDALAAYRKALGLDPASAESLAGQGRALKALGRTAEALASFDQALQLESANKWWLHDRAGVLEAIGRSEDALVGYERALAVDPEFAGAHYSLATLYLRRGDFERGFREYEWRWKVENLQFYECGFPGPAWTGDRDISGKTLLLYADQGLGDTIQFCRYVQLAAAAGAKVILQVQRQLTRLLADLAGADRVIARGDPVPDFDYHSPLCTLPLAFGTRVSTVPQPIAYLRAAPDRVAHWSAQLGGATGPRIGLNWAGNPNYGNDAERSILLPRLLPLLAETELNFFGLQNGLREGDEDILRSEPGIRYIGDQITPFEDTAAVAALMDVVISSDTALVHLAGALGRPVWVLLPFHADWRWLMDRADTPWYPTARLFRQSRPGDWSTVIADVLQELSRLH